MRLVATMEYDDTHIVDCILEECKEIIEDFTYRDDNDERSMRFALAHLNVEQAYFVAKELHEWITEMKKKSLGEKLAKLYEDAKKIDPDTASAISMAEDTLRKGNDA